MFINNLPFVIRICYCVSVYGWDVSLIVQLCSHKQSHVEKTQVLKILIFLSRNCLERWRCPYHLC